MSLEARVTTLEQDHARWDQVLTGLEGTVALVLNEQRERFRQVEGRLDKLERRMDNVEARLDGIETRIDNVEIRLCKIEGLLIQIVGHLTKK